MMTRFTIFIVVVLVTWAPFFEALARTDP